MSRQTAGTLAACFNPRPACRANAGRRSRLRAILHVSIRALRAGRMRGLIKRGLIVVTVSIRALRAGRMKKPSTSGKTRWCFNPRPACRANGIETEYKILIAGFQSAPCVQGEWKAAEEKVKQLKFQSAPCVQGECNGSGVSGEAQDVSIRALRAGRMMRSQSRSKATNRFNPRPACRANEAR